MFNNAGAPLTWTLHSEDPRVDGETIVATELKEDIADSLETFFQDMGINAHIVEKRFWTDAIEVSGDIKGDVVEIE